MKKFFSNWVNKQFEPLNNDYKLRQDNKGQKLRFMAINVTQWFTWLNAFP